MNPSYSRMFSFLKQFLWPYKGRMIVVTLLSATSSVVWLYNIYAFAEVVDFITKYKAGDSLMPVYVIAILWAASVLVRHVTAFLTRYIGVGTAEQAGMDMQAYSIRYLSLLDISWHEKENSGNKLKRIDRVDTSIKDLVKSWQAVVIDIAITSIGSFIIIFRFDRRLVLATILYLIVYYILAKITNENGMKAYRFANKKEEEITGLWYEIISNIRSVKVLGMVSQVLEFSHEMIVEYVRRAKQRISWFQGGTAAQGIWQGLVRIVFIIVVIQGIIRGQYEVGFLVLFIGYFNSLSDSISRMADAAQDLGGARVNIGRLLEMLDEPINIDKEQGKVGFPTEWDAIHFKDISFKYGTNSVLSNVTFDIKKGEKIGIVGLSGAGKSTIFKLLMKEHESYDGEILIGTTPLKSISKSAYVDHIAAVLQETEVFNMSLRRNIEIASKSTTSETNGPKLFEQTLDIAHIKDFLPKLPKGAETLVGEKGIKLSGGEKQRLGIARAVFKQPEILFLDEATSHLDVESEQKIQDSLKKFFANVTAVVIAHRLSTIREMDRIIVLEGGKIIETGTFNELHAGSGRFREFWDKQSK